MGLATGEDRNGGKRCQSAVEYATLLVIVIGAIVAIQVYVKRGMQGGIKSSIDKISDQFSPKTRTEERRYWAFEKEVSKATGDGHQNVYFNKTEELGVSRNLGGFKEEIVKEQ